MLSLFLYYCLSQSMFLPPWRHAKYKGQTNEYGIQSLELDFHMYALLFNFDCTKILSLRKRLY